MGGPLVHVLVINWNGVAHLQDCFDSLLLQTYANARFILLDNASTDDSIAYVSSRYGSDPRVSVLSCGENLGWSRGNNLGIAKALEANADYIFLLNNDTAVAADAIEQLVSFAESHPNAGAIAPKMLLFDQPFLINSIAIACSPIAGAWDEGLGRCDGPRYAEPSMVLGVCGGAMLLKAAALRVAGVLPEDFEIYLDDLDLCLRIWDAGFECWSCPAATVRHKFSATMGEGKRAQRKYYLNTRNRLRLMIRNFPSAKLFPALAQFALNEARAIGRATLDGAFWKVAAHIRSWFTTVFSLPRLLRQRRNRYGVHGRFWNHISEDATFFPGIALPVNGWYEPKTIGSLAVKPISARAWTVLSQGRLRVTHANCYPRCGATRVNVINNGRNLGLLSTTSSGIDEFSIDEGEVSFESDRVFLAEETGEPCDIGGWLHLEHFPS
ncbi:MAG TPA: glycosyltransferase family 2 protein [Candidatus Hydrogenedentes bacterium]|nr:glycosyltransferase family 2 protein [Candidatus Hydrogenedentota bacterium]HRK35800.1 glycosyltransferase family 2 protein [Candidatus Hydrogenedentota bacterium]